MLGPTPSAPTTSFSAWASGLRPWDRRGLAGFILLFVIFAGAVEFRSACLNRRFGDLDVFLRAAWALRTGADPYASTDNYGAHYCYPPLLAIALMPLADPPPGFDSAGFVPFPASVAIFYLANVLALGIGVLVLASAFEEVWLVGRIANPSYNLLGRIGNPTFIQGSRAWWGLRVFPVLACLVPIGHTLIRCQTNLFVLGFLCASLAGILRGRSWWGGFWLAGAICLKIYPAFLLLYALWRRDGRYLLGCAAGLVVGLVLIPVLIIGPARTMECNRQMLQAIILPGLGLPGDQARASELTNTTATDSQSLVAVAHKTLYRDYDTRPDNASFALRLGTGLLGVLLTLATLAAAGWQKTRDPVNTVLLYGGLIVNMLLLCPVCHLNYFSLLLPLCLGLLAARWEKGPGLKLGPGLLVLFLINTVAGILPHLPGLERLRDQGLAMYATLAVWVVGVVVLWKRIRKRGQTPSTRDLDISKQAEL